MSLLENVLNILTPTLANDVLFNVNICTPPNQRVVLLLIAVCVSDKKAKILVSPCSDFFLIKITVQGDFRMVFRRLSGMCTVCKRESYIFDDDQRAP